MTLNRVRDIFQTVSIAEVDIKEFQYGDKYEVAISPVTQYPIVFLETPYNIVYNNNRKTKSYQFAVLVLLKTEEGSVEIDHDASSIAEDIGDAIFSKIQNEYSGELVIENLRGLSLGEGFSRDYLGGIRFELTVTVNRNYSIPSCYEDKFVAKCTDC